jgi:hypothetical protein
VQTVALDLFNDLPGAIMATVTPLGGQAIQTIVNWRREEIAPDDRQMYGSMPTTVNARTIAWVRRDDVPSLPMKSQILGGPIHQQKTWTVLTVDESHPHFHIAVVN